MKTQPITIIRLRLYYYLDFLSACSDNVCPERGRLMTQEQAISETQYLLARSVYLELYGSGRITALELQLALEAAAKKYDSMIGELEVNSNAIENCHENRLSAESSTGSNGNS